MDLNAPATGIEGYIARFPVPVQRRLTAVRRAIRKALPTVTEAIKYRIPTFVLDGRNLVHFAAFANHIGFYPAPRGVPRFKKQLSAYKGGKGTVQFPHDRPLPLALIVSMAKFRAGEAARKRRTAAARTKAAR